MLQSASDAHLLLGDIDFSSKVDGAAHDVSADVIKIPDAHLLFSGDYKRAGLDLVLTDHGQEHVVHDYFRGQHRATLASPDGASLSGAVVEALAGYVQYAQAGPGANAANMPIGHVAKLQGGVTAIRNGVAVTLNTGDAVNKGDVIQTGSGSTISVTFADGTALNLSANTRMALNEFAFDPASTSNAGVFSLVQGGFAFVAGQVAKTGGLNIETPVATMGIRGTIGGGSCAEAGKCEFYAALEFNGENSAYKLLTGGTFDSQGHYVGGTEVGTVTVGTNAVVSANGVNQPLQIAFVPAAAADPAIAALVSQLVGNYPQFFSQPTQQSTPQGSPSGSGNPQPPPQPGPDDHTQNDTQPIVHVTIVVDKDGGPPETHHVDVPNTPAQQGLPPPPPPVNHAPVVSVSPVVEPSITEDHSVLSFTAANLLTASGASDPDNGLQSLSIINFTPVSAVDQFGHTVNPPSNPLNITLAPDGVTLVSASIDPGVFNYLQAGQSVTLTAGFDVSDGNLSVHDTASITITGVNDAPVAQAGSGSGGEDTLITGHAVATDVDNAASDLSYALVTDAVDGNGHPVSGLTFHTDGSYSFQGPQDFNGTVSFTYKANDGSLDSNAATVTLTVNPVNDAPVAQAGSGSGNEDTLITGHAVATDVDNAASDLSYALVTDAVDGNGHPVSGLTFHTDGSYSFQGPQDFNGTVSFTYKANDGSLDSNAATVTLTVNPVNDAPVAQAGSGSGNEDTLITGHAVATDVDNAASDLSYALVTDAVDGNGHPVSGLTFHTDGSYSFQGPQDFNGTVSFTYKANDGSLDSNAATVTLTVNPVNDAPVAQAGSGSGNEDTLITGHAVATDVDNAASDLSYALVTDAVDGNGHPVSGLTFHTDGSYSFQGPQDFNGTVSFTYKANDGSLDSNAATVTLTVNPVNDAPVVVDDGPSTTTIYSDNFNDHSFNFDGSGFAWTAVSLGNSNMSWSMTGSNAAETSNSGLGFLEAPTAVIPSTATSYTINVDADPNPNADLQSIFFNHGDSYTNNGLGVVFGYSNANDYYLVDWNDFGTNYSNQSTFRDLVLEHVVNGSVTVLDSVNDIDLGNSNVHFTVAVDSSGISVDVTGDEHSAHLSSATNPALGDVGLYTNDNDSGIAYDNFSVTIPGLQADEDHALTVSAANGVLLNDTDVDSPHSSLSVASVNGFSGNVGTQITLADGAHLTVNSDGSFVYDPTSSATMQALAAGATALETFTYKTTDGSLDSNTATVTLTVKGVNDAPSAPADNNASVNSVAEGASAGTLVGITAHSTDIDSPTITYSLAGDTSNGGFQINSNTGVVTVLNGSKIDYESAPGHAYSITVQASDGTLSSSQSFGIGITDVDEAPTITSGGTASVNENLPASTVVYTATASDPDTTAPFNTKNWSLTGTDAPLLSINSSGQVTLKASADFETKSSYSFNVVDTDGGGLAASKAVVLSINNVNEAPTITSGGTASVNENLPASTVVYTATASDPDTTAPFNTKNWSLTGTDASLLSINSSGQVTLKASADFETKSSYSFNVVDTDGGGLAASKAVVLSINNVNETPVATITAASYSATEQTNLTLQGPGLSISDVDAGSGSETVTLSVGEGTLNVSAGNSGAGVSGSGSSSVTITGTVTQIDNLLHGTSTGFGSAGTITYIDNTDTPSASTTLTLLVHDNGNTGGGDLSASDTATINIAAVNDPPVIIAPSGLQYDPASGDDTTAFNSIAFSDVDTTGNVTVHFTRTGGNGTLSASSFGFVTVGGNSTDMTLTGTIDAINTFIAADHVTLDTQGNDTDTFMITINDGTTTVSKSGFAVSDVSFTSTSGADINNYAGVDVYETSLSAGRGSDTVYTSWNHLGSSPTNYTDDSANVGSDTIYLNFTVGQLQEILTDTANRNDLQTFLFDANSNDLSLGSTSWHATVANGLFETAHIELANVASTRDTTTPSNNYFDIDTIWHSVIAPNVAANNEILGLNGTSGNDFVIANAAGTVTGLAGNDVLVARSAGNTLDGGTGNNFLLGGSGADTLIGGTGTDLMAGGAGSDTFVFNQHFGNDTVVDFKNSGSEHDVIDLSDFNFTNQQLTDLLAAAHAEAGHPANTVLAITANDSITFDNVTLAAVQNANNYQLHH